MQDAAKAKRDSAARVRAAGIVARAVLALAVLGGIPRFVQAQLSDVPPTAAAQIVKVTPDSVAAGSSVTIQITGGNFSAGVYVSFATPAVRVVSTERKDAARLSASIEINPSAQPGTVTLYVSNPAGAAAQTSFSILPAVQATRVLPGGGTTTATAPAQPQNAPQVTSVEPAMVGPGSRCTLKVKGKGFADGAVISFSNPGVQVLATRFKKSSELEVDVQIASDAATGPGGLFVVNPDDSEVEYSFDISGKAVTTEIPSAPTTTTLPATTSTPSTTVGKSEVKTSEQKFEVYNVGNAGSILHNPGQAKGSLIVAGGRLRYEDGGKEVFSVGAGEIQEIGVNVIFGINTGTFHVILRGSRTYNFAGATLRPADTESMVNSLRQALQMN